MNTQVLEKSKMDAIKELADTSIKISEAKNIIFKLQEDETEYLVLREKKALEKIEKVVRESKELLEQSKSNYEEIHGLCRQVSELILFLTTTQSSLADLLREFNERSDLWDIEVKDQLAEIEEVKRKNQIDKTLIENDQKTIKVELKKLENEQIKINDQRETIKRIIERLKNNKI